MSESASKSAGSGAERQEKRERRGRHFGLQFDVEACKKARDAFHERNNARRLKTVQSELDHAQKLYADPAVWAVRLCFDRMTRAEERTLKERLRGAGILLSLVDQGESIEIADAASAGNAPLHDAADGAPQRLVPYLAKTQTRLVV